MDNDVVKKNVYDKLVSNVNAIDNRIQNTGGLFTKTQYESDRVAKED